MAIKDMSPNSTSFLRFKEFSEGINLSMTSNAFGNSKTDNLSYMMSNQLDKREVFYAENINIKTEIQIKNIKKKLGEFIQDELKKEGKWAKGIVEIHPTKPDLVGKRVDYTSKHAHIHYWGNNPQLVAPLINKFIIKNKLTNKTSNNLSFGSMELGVYYKQNEKLTTDDGYAFDIKDGAKIIGTMVESLEDTVVKDTQGNILTDYESSQLVKSEVAIAIERIETNLDMLDKIEEDNLEFLKAFLNESDLNIKPISEEEIEVELSEDVTQLSALEMLEENRKFLDDLFSDLDIDIEIEDI